MIFDFLVDVLHYLEMISNIAKGIFDQKYILLSYFQLSCPWAKCLNILQLILDYNTYFLYESLGVVCLLQIIKQVNKKASAF